MNIQALAANILYPSISKRLYEPAVTNDKPPSVEATEPEIMPELKLPPIEISATNVYSLDLTKIHAMNTEALYSVSPRATSVPAIR